MVKIDTTLEELDFTKNESKVLIYLLHNGVKSGNAIYTSLKLEKSSVYKALHSLEARGVVSSSGAERDRLYQAVGISKIQELFDEKQERVRNAKASFNTLLADFEKYSTNNYFNENISIYSDENAFFDYHKELLKYPIDMISSFAESQSEYKLAGSKSDYLKFNKWFIPERIEKGVSIRVLYDRDALIDPSNLTYKKLLKECRQFDGDLNMNSIFSIFGDRVGFTTVKEDRFWALVIKDKLISSSLLAVYNILWNLSKVK